jgi:hypothetical protein
MMFLINISFFVLTMPIVILHLIYSLNINYKLGITWFNEHSFELVKSICELLQSLNHSTNFILYCLTGVTFRKEAKTLMLNMYNHLKFIK